MYAYGLQHMRTRVSAVLNRYALDVVPTVSAGVFGGELGERSTGDSWEEVAKQKAQLVWRDLLANYRTIL